jgi:hypothetical protein
MGHVAFVHHGQSGRPANETVFAPLEVGHGGQNDQNKFGIFLKPG